jgi:hypothetical protein
MSPSHETAARAASSCIVSATSSNRETHVNGDPGHVALANPSLLSTCAGGYFLRCPGDIRHTYQVSARSRSDKTRQGGSTVYGVEGPRLRSCVIVPRYERVAFRLEPFLRNCMFWNACLQRVVLAGLVPKPAGACVVNGMDLVDAIGVGRLSWIS